MFRFLCILVAIAVNLSTAALAQQPATLGEPGSTRWIWFPEGNPAHSAPAGVRYLRGVFVLPADAKVRSARFSFTADDICTLYINGKLALQKRTGWNEVETLDITPLLVPGKNVLAIEGTNATSAAGVVGWLIVQREKAAPVVFVTDARWKACAQKVANWESPKFDDATWPAAMELGPLQMPPWEGAIRRSGHVQRLGLPPARRDDKPVTAEQAVKMIEEDWLFQADGTITPELCLREIGWARKLAARLNAAPGHPDFQGEFGELAALESRLRALPADQEDDVSQQLYLAVRRVKRRMMFKNPLLNFDRILLADSPGYAGAHESAHRNGYFYDANAGGRLVVLEGLKPDGRERDLLPDAGFIMRMDLSFDASRIVFGMKPKGQRSFHLYEINADGTRLRQLTNSAYDDMDPIYLPDGKIIFSTSRGNTYVRCLPPSASTVLARCDADGKNIYIISRNNEPDYTPTLLPDGRVLYTRWEYTERPLWRLQKLWTINPDGTGEAVYYGNNSAYPDVLWEARPIPGTDRVIFAGVGHHNVNTGCLGILDINQGRDYPNGIRKITAELPWPEVGDSPSLNPVASQDYHSGGFYSYRCPWPLGPEDFLVSASRAPNQPFGLYLMDIDGNRELIYAGRQNVFYARPLLPRQAPAAMADRVAWAGAGEHPQPGVLFSPNVYAGVEGLPAGKARFLRVIQMDAKTYAFPFKSWRHSGPVISVIQEDGVKRILGTVPIQADGSVCFKVPAGRALHFQILDERQRCVQIMRSFTGVMSGEARGCLGCHAQHSVAPPTGADPAALRRPPVEITAPSWGADVSISYERFCQPILDKYCGQCHEGNGKARAKLDLTLRGGEQEKGIADPRLLPFKEPYLTLVGPSWNSPIRADAAGAGLAGCLNVETSHHYGPLAPMTMLSATSPLIEMVTSGRHHDVKIDGEDLQKLIAWVDCNCVYRGDEEVRQIPDPDPAGMRVYPVPFKTHTAPHIERLQPVTDSLGQ